jgi:hypothetical protein
MQLPVILKALQRHKITVAILLLEFAVTFALLSNASILVWQRFSALRTISGVQEQGLLVANVAAATPGAAPPTADKLSSAIAAIEGIRGVRAVSVLSQTPFSGVDSLLGRVACARRRLSSTRNIRVLWRSKDARCLGVPSCGTLVQCR